MRTTTRKFGYLYTLQRNTIFIWVKFILRSKTIEGNGLCLDNIFCMKECVCNKKKKKSKCMEIRKTVN